MSLLLCLADYFYYQVILAYTKLKLNCFKKRKTVEKTSLLFHLTQNQYILAMPIISEPYSNLYNYAAVAL